MHKDVFTLISFIKELDGIGNNGVLVEHDDYEIISWRILKIINNPSEHFSFVNNGLLHVSENFRYEKRFNDFQKILNSLE